MRQQSWQKNDINCVNQQRAPERLLHRRIYADTYGEIPPDFEVHHRNGNWQDNTLENLELRSATQHARAHMRERWQTAEGSATMQKGLEKAVEAAKEWHASDAGRAWHALHGTETWKDRETFQATCVVCQASFQTFFPTRAQFCSKACKSARTYRTHKTATGACLSCGKTFVYNEYRRQQCCSRGCGIRYRLHSKEEPA